MRRRDMLGLLAASATTSCLSGAAEAADEHAKGGPLENVHTQLCAFHNAKKDPAFQVQAYHYCSQLNDDLFQCMIFDSNAKNARLLGVEYIITDRVYRTLPEVEKKYYHSHTYEILSGLLIAMGLPADEDRGHMEPLLTTWGKTWHTWPDPKTPLPMGEPLLMWSITRDGQIDPTLLADRDRQYNVSTAEVRKRRAGMGPVPQIDPPRSLDTLGRQWTNEGPDIRPSK